MWTLMPAIHHAQTITQKCVKTETKTHKMRRIVLGTWFVIFALFVKQFFHISSSISRLSVFLIKHSDKLWIVYGDWFVVIRSSSLFSQIFHHFLLRGGSRTVYYRHYSIQHIFFYTNRCCRWNKLKFVILSLKVYTILFSSLYWTSFHQGIQWYCQRL